VDYLKNKRLSLEGKRLKAFKELGKLSKTDRYGVSINEYLRIRTRERKLNRFLEETENE